MGLIDNNVVLLILVIALIFSLLLLFNIKGWNLNIPDVQKTLLGTVTMESMENKVDIESELNSMKLNQLDSFCENHRESGSALNQSCNKLTQDNCNSTSCCVWLNNEKCVAGGEDGPTFQTQNGKKIDVDTYYYQNKCYGNNCK